jgi:two-component system, NarL family, nitrate/nitrite response regulator NarL
MVAALLRSEFDVVGTAANGQEALAIAARLRPQVVVLDICMPVLDGIEAAIQLRATDSSAKVVFLTVQDHVQFVRACFAAGALGYVAKGRIAIDLIPAVHDAVAGRRFISAGLRGPDEEPI